MRSDIAKVVVERPRVGGGGAPGKHHTRAIDWKRTLEEGREEESFTRETIRRKWKEGYSGKTSSDFLSPIRGFLQKSIGRRWDDVYSEVSKFLKPTSVMQRHVLEHLRDYVRMDIVSDDNDWLIDTKGCYVRPLSSSIFPTFYVRPSDGTLQLANPDKEPPREIVVPRNSFHYLRRLPDLSVDNEIPDVQKKYHKRDGIWYRLEFSVAPVLKTKGGWIVCGRLVSYVDLCELRRQNNLLTFMACPGYATEPVFDVWEKRRTDSRTVAQDEYEKIEKGKIDRFSPYANHWLRGGLFYCSAKFQVGKKEKRREGLV